MFEEIDVDADKLLAFSKKITELSQPLSISLTQPVSNMAGAPLGACNIPDAISVRLYHVALLDQVQGFMKDTFMGLGALGMGSMTIGFNYITDDITASNAMTGVADAFVPKAGQNSLSSEQKKQEAAGVDDDKKVVPDSELPAYDGSNPADGTPQQGSELANAQEQSSQHESAYGNVENGYGGYTYGEIADEVSDGDAPQWMFDYMADPLHFSGDIN